jgi:hypothetical protein
LLDARPKTLASKLGNLSVSDLLGEDDSLINILNYDIVSVSLKDFSSSSHGLVGSGFLAAFIKNNPVMSWIGIGPMYTN